MYWFLDFGEQETSGVVQHLWAVVSDIPHQRIACPLHHRSDSKGLSRSRAVSRCRDLATDHNLSDEDDRHSVDDIGGQFVRVGRDETVGLEPIAARFLPGVPQPCESERRIIRILKANGFLSCLASTRIAIGRNKAAAFLEGVRHVRLSRCLPSVR